MPKTPLSVTLDADNLLWLRGRAAARKARSLSEALDDLITQARQGRAGGTAPRSVVGTVDISDDDPDLGRADAEIRDLFSASTARRWAGREGRPAAPRSRAVKAGTKRRG